MNIRTYSLSKFDKMSQYNLFIYFLHVHKKMRKGFELIISVSLGMVPTGRNTNYNTKKERMFIE
jgi:hypothetical protein